MMSKLTSRKWWTAVCGIIVGLALAFGADGDTITSVAGAVTSLVSIVVYILAEAGVDKANMTIVVDSLEDIEETAEEEEE